MAGFLIPAIIGAGTSYLQAKSRKNKEEEAHRREQAARQSQIQGERQRRARVQALAQHFGVQLPDNIWQLYMNPSDYDIAGDGPAAPGGIDWLSVLGAGATAGGQAYADSQQTDMTDDIVNRFLSGRLGTGSTNPYLKDMTGSYSAGGGVSLPQRVKLR